MNKWWTSGYALRTAWLGQKVCVGRGVEENNRYQNVCYSELSFTIHDFTVTKIQCPDLLSVLFFEDSACLRMTCLRMGCESLARVRWQTRIPCAYTSYSNDSIYLYIYLKKLPVTQKLFLLWPNTKTSFNMFTFRRAPF